MPRLTYAPSRSSRATRAASWLRGSATLFSLALTGTRADRDALDALAAAADFDDALHEDAGQVNRFGIDLTRFDELLDFRDCDLPGHRAQRVEVAGGFVKDQVAVPIADAGAHEREVAHDALFEHVLATAEDACFFFRRCDGNAAAGTIAPRQAAVGDQRADAGRRVERRNSGAAGAHAFGERALRNEFDFDFTAEILALELFVLTDVRADRAANPLRAEQDAQALLVDAAVVRDRDEVGGTGCEERPDQGAAER